MARDYSYIFNAHPTYIESLYKSWHTNPASVDEGWQLFFKGFDFNGGNGSTGTQSVDSAKLTKEFGIVKLIQAFRMRGHLLSTTNPIKARKNRKPHLDLADYWLSEDDLDQSFNAAQEIMGAPATLRQLIDQLMRMYAQNIGFEFMHIENMEQRHWLKEEIERRVQQEYFGLTLEKKKRILEKLNGAVMFEKFLHTKYVGQKRFSLEGGETTIPALDTMINEGARHGVEEVVIGMAHRGRLNVLANIMGKTYEQIFNEFEGTAVPDLSYGDGDVKYHLGYSSIVKTTASAEVHLKLVPNPSHLESVNPVVEGFARAKADILYNSKFSKILPILIHGDAAVAGQGVVYETIQMSKLKGYYTGGTIHFVINNQIGFTTDFDDARSTTYCTGLANAIQGPVFHVNGDDPEAVIFVTELAIEFRQKFNVDVFIDMVCYRRHGHNEGDDPKFTQPEMYNIISKHPNPREVYVNTLISRGNIDRNLGQDLEKSFWDNLQARLDLVKQKPLSYEYQEPEMAWRSLDKTNKPEDFEQSPITGIDSKQLEQILNHLCSVPEGFEPLGKVNRLRQGMTKAIENDQLDWGLAELSAYGSILLQNKDVRISGQDVKRGTFSHRHAVFYDANNFQEHNRLNSINKEQGNFRIYNSLLSEFAVLGFEYGYSMASPDNLVIWEAQFGDFYNGAQVIVDQYISAGQSKWQRMSGLVMLLPHGYEGQGPEHSSARLERFLQLCAEYNMVVINPSTPANQFHALRRQLEWNFRKPLIVMSPKSLLRHPACVSCKADLTGKTRFQETIDDAEYVSAASAKKVKRVIFCTGKVFYGLDEFRRSNNIKDTAIVRIEQLYPFPAKQVEKILSKYANAMVVWAQEEPVNMGAWPYLAANFPGMFGQCFSRKASASPATGFKKVHDAQEETLFKGAFGV
jgi:2-oxoglutarate dehydrogenase E1 component